MILDMIEFTGDYEPLFRPKVYLWAALGCFIVCGFAALIDRGPLVYMSSRFGLLLLVLGLTIALFRGSFKSKRYEYKSDLEEAEDRDGKFRQ